MFVGFLFSLGAVDAAEFRLEPDALRPPGEYYEATVPDTLDLAERARLAVTGLTLFLNPEDNYSPYGHAYFNTEPAWLTNQTGADGAWNWGKIAESTIMARLMSGSEENLDIQARSLEGMLAYSGYPGNIAAHPTSLARMMLALMALDAQSPSPEIEETLVAMARYIRQTAQEASGGFAYFAPYGPEWKEETQDSMIGVHGYGQLVYHNGTPARALARWGVTSGDREALELAGKLTRFVVQPQFWRPEAEPKAFYGADHAHFSGHSHCYTAALMGLLWQARATHDPRLMEFVRGGYEYARGLGLARIGLYGEMCATADMTFLAAQLSRLGIGDYWEDVDQYARNHLTELQLRDAPALKKVVETMPKLDPGDNRAESTDRVIERCQGSFLSDAGHPTRVPPQTLLWTICCTGNCAAALYYVWDSIVEERDGAAQVNLPLNRASPWLDVDSYLPYEGKVAIRNKTAKKISLRLPRWVDRGAVRTAIGGVAAAPFRVGNYLVFDAVQPGDTITIEFPVTETVEIYTLKWKDEDFWKESTNPNNDWRPPDEPTRYTLRMRGNTLVEIAPRAEGPGLQLYEREAMKATAAPMKKVTRFVSPARLEW